MLPKLEIRPARLCFRARDEHSTTVVEFGGRLIGTDYELDACVSEDSAVRHDQVRLRITNLHRLDDHHVRVEVRREGANTGGDFAELNVIAPVA